MLTSIYYEYDTYIYYILWIFVLAYWEKWENFLTKLTEIKVLRVEYELRYKIFFHFSYAKIVFCYKNVLFFENKTIVAFLLFLSDGKWSFPRATVSSILDSFLISHSVIFSYVEIKPYCNALTERNCKSFIQLWTYCILFLRFSIYSRRNISFLSHEGWIVKH